MSKINVKRKEKLLAAIYEFGLWSTQLDFGRKMKFDAYGHMREN